MDKCECMGVWVWVRVSACEVRNLFAMVISAFRVVMSSIVHFLYRTTDVLC